MSESTPAPEAEMQSITFPRQSIDLFGKQGSESLLTTLMKNDSATQEGQTAQQTGKGRKIRPFDMRAVTAFQHSNEHHATCIRTKVAATVGLGFRTAEDMKDEPVPPVPSPAQAVTRQPPPIKPALKKFALSKPDEILNPLCHETWQEVMNDACEDYWQVGVGYIEVVRKGQGDAITGLFHLPAPDVHVYVEDSYNMHYEITGSDTGNGLSGVTRKFARFGDKQGLIERSKTQGSGFELPINPVEISEVIRFRMPSSLNRWYSIPDWLSCVPAIELSQCKTQHQYDFYLNRGVPEFMLFLLGNKLTKDDWKKVEDALRANIGLGNSRKSIALNLTDRDMKVELHKLAMEGKTDTPVDGDDLGLRIVTAHRVPPLLAGIQIPGKLGATNELPNALMAFQSLVVGQAQRQWQQRLGVTLGNKSLNGGLALTMEDFTFKTILDEINLGAADTMSRMRTPVAAAPNRNLNAGLKN